MDITIEKQLPRDYERKIEKRFEPWVQAISEEEYISTQTYTSEYGFAVNDYLRNTNAADEILDLTLIDEDLAAQWAVSKIVRHIDEALDRAPSLPDEGITVYRGMRGLQAFDTENLTPGVVYEDYGFLSTSIDYHRARSFLPPEHVRGGYLICLLYTSPSPRDS